MQTPEILSATTAPSNPSVQTYIVSQTPVNFYLTVGEKDDSEYSEEEFKSDLLSTLVTWIGVVFAALIGFVTLGASALAVMGFRNIRELKETMQRDLDNSKNEIKDFMEKAKVKIYDEVKADLKKEESDNQDPPKDTPKKQENAFDE